MHLSITLIPQVQDEDLSLYCHCSIPLQVWCSMPSTKQSQTQESLVFIDSIKVLYICVYFHIKLNRGREQESRSCLYVFENFWMALSCRTAKNTEPPASTLKDQGKCTLKLEGVRDSEKIQWPLHLQVSIFSQINKYLIYSTWVFQARILEWVVISFSRGSSWSKDRNFISCISRWVLYCWDKSLTRYLIIWK